MHTVHCTCYSRGAQNLLEAPELHLTLRDPCLPVFEIEKEQMLQFIVGHGALDFPVSSLNIRPQH